MNDKSPEDKDLGLSLIETIGSSDLSDLSQELTEVALDSLLQEGILKDIPIIGTIVGVAKTAIHIRDKLLVRKIIDFLRELKITPEERARFLSDIEGDKNFQRRIGENLLMLLDRLDDLQKPAMIAKLFKAYLQDVINYQEFVSFASVIDRAFVNDLTGLLNSLTDKRGKGEDYYAERLYHLGLAEIKFDDSLYLQLGQKVRRARPNPFHKPIQFKFSENAYVLAQILLGKKIHGYDFLETYRSQREFRKG